MTKGEYMKSVGVNIKNEEVFLDDECDQEFMELCDGVCAMSRKINQMKKDPVNHPEHYETGKYECFDVMLECLGQEVVLDFCIGNAFKYLYRHRNKNGIEDVKKAQWYINKWIQIIEELNNEDC